MKRYLKLHIRWFLSILLLAGLATPVVAAPSSVDASTFIAQADEATPADANADVEEQTEEQETSQKKTRAVVAQTKEGKYALMIVIGAVLLLFVLIFVKSSKLG